MIPAMTTSPNDQILAFVHRTRARLDDIRTAVRDGIPNGGPKLTRLPPSDLGTLAAELADLEELCHQHKPTTTTADVANAATRLASRLAETGKHNELEALRDTFDAELIDYVIPVTDESPQDMFGPTDSPPK
ncbi:MAG: hypothetical protein OXI79_19595 [Gammaproteobacteria bacterium]|nr:hypothetical protein [Gammaproteobacteria bacterium]